MFKNYFKTAFRNLLKHKMHAFINILGLVIGIACCLIILLFVQDELSYDRFHAGADDMYRIVSKAEVGGRTVNLPTSPAPMARAMKNDFPEVISAVTVADMRKSLMVYNDRQFYENGIILADSTLFDVFSFNLLKGNPKTALADVHSVILSEETAKKYFGGDDPMGKVIRMENKFDLKVTGIVEKPRQSHFTFDMLIPIQILNEIIAEGYTRFWVDLSNYTYFRLGKNASPSDLEAKLPAFVEKYCGNDLRKYGVKWEPTFQSLTDIHLYSKFEVDIGTPGDIKYVYIFSAIALFVLLIACLNYMNLSTARSANRAKEVGLRKVVGANRGELMRQFLIESLVLTFIGLTLAVGVVLLSLSCFNAFIGKELSLFDNPVLFIAGILGITVFIGVLAGSYPAFFLSSFNPIDVLKGKFKAGAKSAGFRMALVIIQFTISIILIISTAMVYKQLRFIQNKKLGFNKEQVIVVPMRDPSLQAKYESIRAEIGRIPSVTGVAASSDMPCRGKMVNLFVPEGAKDNEGQAMQSYRVDYDFIDVMGMEMAQGRKFSKDMKTDEAQAFIINETAAKSLGWEQPIGKRWKWVSGDGNREGTVIGVVKDFHTMSLHQPVEPVVMCINRDEWNNAIIRFQTDNVLQTVGAIETKWKAIDPSRPFEYYFYDEVFEDLYRTENKLMAVVGYFSMLAIFVACLGLFGLASFTAEQRTKEMGIRKTLGATMANIVLLLSKEFTKWVIIANVIAWPAAYYAMDHWLQNFAYRTDIGIAVFIASGTAALLIALLTVSFQSVKTALANPIESLRYE